ncbi:tight adherance operon protein [Mixta theicola]|uniref:Tight adherance operon protein n=1 Tax=Mixta theicola TaxID=1458355 RepID=A0A2K1Q9Y0_9GAMM|nr:tight adherance operon protein [Mixta theicola]PNS11843.1 tight adherance operon protein [Mixta theicola]GLR07768.1 pilus assembly protein CpaE [Mixta theicola]
MLLFLQKEEKASFKEMTFYVLSAREDVNEQLSQLLRLAGFSQVEKVHQSLGQVRNLTLSPQAGGMIIDIGAQTQVEEIVPVIQALVPRNIWCCVTGDSDSITLAQSFARHGIAYFYLKAQNDEMMQAAASGATAKARRWAVSVSVLGCKGGIGNTTLAWQLANRLVNQRQMPTLFIQGRAGSRDLDLVIGKKLSRNVVAVNKHLDAMGWEETHFPPIQQEAFEKYNFVVFEESINAADKEQMRQIVERTSCLILTMDRSMSSVRRVCSLIEMIDAINRSQSTPRRVLLCLNDSRPVTSEMLSLEDLQALLGRQLDVIFPYHKERTVTYFPALRRQRSPLETLAQKVLGESTPVKTSLVQRLTGKREEG